MCNQFDSNSNPNQRQIFSSTIREMEKQSHLVILLLLFAAFSAAAAPDTLLPKTKSLGNLRNVLQLIFTYTCAATNMSIFVSTEYRNFLPLEEVRLVDSVLDRILHRRSLDAQLPILLDEKMSSGEINQIVQLMMFFVEDVAHLEWYLNGTSKATATHKHKFLLVMLTNETREQSQLRMREIFAYMLHERMNIDTVLLLVQLQRETVGMYTFLPYGTSSKPSCESYEPVELPLHKALRSQLYPPKLHNLHGCPLNAILWNIPPYLELHPLRANVEDQLQGWDAVLFKLLAKRLNFRITWTANDPPDLVGGTVYMNGTFTGVYGMLRERRGNLTFGCTACNAARAKYFTNTVSYNQVEYIILFPEGKAYSYYEIMLLPYKCCTWTLLVIMAVIHLLFRSFRHWRHLVPSPAKLGWIMLLFMLRIGYEGSIFEFVHNAPVRPLPLTWEQTMRENYSIIMDHATHRMISSIPSLTDRASIYPGTPVDMFDYLLQQPAGGRFGILTSRDFLYYYLARHRKEHHSFVMLEKKLMNNIICMHFPLGSYLGRAISQLLFDLRSFGICQQLTKIPIWANPSLTTATRIRPLTYAQDDHFTQSTRFLHAAFYCLLCAESLILWVFLLELLSLHPRFGVLHWLFQRL